MTNVGPASFTFRDDRWHARDRSHRNRRSRSPDLRREARTDARPRAGADQGRRHRRQLHRHLLPIRPVPAGRSRSSSAPRCAARSPRSATTSPRSTSATASSRRRPTARTPNTAVAPADFVAYVPDAVPADVAASALLKGMTAHYLLKSVYPVQQGDTVLVHAGAGGVGLILTQWATSMAVKVITTVSTTREGRTVPAGGRGRGARLPGRPGRVRRQDPRAHRRQRRRRGLRRRRRVDVRRQPGQPGRARHARPVRRVQRTGSAVRPAAAQQRGLAVPDPAHAGALHPHVRRILLAGGRTARRDRDGDHQRHGQRALPTWPSAAKAHTDLQGRKTVGSVVLVP